MTSNTSISLQKQLEALDIQIEVNEVELSNLPEGHQDALHAVFETVAASRWRPIATEPPPDDTEVEAGLWDETGTYIMNDHFSSSRQCWCDWEATVNAKLPTHWRPLPPPPAEPQR